MDALGIPRAPTSSHRRSPMLGCRATSCRQPTSNSRGSSEHSPCFLGLRFLALRARAPATALSLTTAPALALFRVAAPSHASKERRPPPEHRRLTRRCSGLASLAAELHSLGLARGAYTNYGTPASAQGCRAVPVPSHCLWQVSSEVSGSASWSPWRRRTASLLRALSSFSQRRTFGIRRPSMHRP